MEAPVTSENWKVTPYYLFGFLGIAAYASWLLLQYINPAAQFDAAAILSGDIPSLLIFVPACAASLTLVWATADFFSTPKGRIILIVAAFVCSPLSALNQLLFSESPTLVTNIIWAVTAIGYASLMLLWSTLLVTLKGTHVPVFVAAIVIAGAVIFVYVACTFEPIGYVFQAILPALSALLFVISFRFRGSVVPDSQSTLNVSSADTDDKNPVTWQIVADCLTYTPCLGIGIYCAIHYVSYPLNVTIIGIATLASCAFVIVDFTRIKMLTSKMQLKLFLLLAACTVFPLSFVSGLAMTIFVFLVFLVFMLSLVTNYAAVSECSRIFELNPIRYFSYGRAWTICGVLLGYLFAAFAFSESVAAVNGGTILAFAALMLVFIFASTFILEDRYPISSDVPDDLESDAIPQPPKRDAWDKCCEVIARRYDLSPRQTEVLQLLAKGRNTTYIQDKLVISPYTAKAHIYNIYQKIGIHSRQELLDLIEEVEL